MGNLNMLSDSDTMNVLIRITIVIIQMGSLVLAYLRLFGSKKLAGGEGCCGKEDGEEEGEGVGNEGHHCFDDTERRVVRRDARGDVAEGKLGVGHQREQIDNKTSKVK